MRSENDIATVVLDTCFRIHKELGPGLLESAYEQILVNELTKIGLKAKRQVPIPIKFSGIKVAEGFRADVIVEDKVLLELKSQEKILAVHKRQLLTYIRLADKRLGLLINFGGALLKTGITRMVNGLPEATPSFPQVSAPLTSSSSNHLSEP